MSNIKCTTLRFNLDKPLDRQAWDYLQSTDKDEFKSYSQAVAVAVTEYFENYYRLKDDPYLETREREERFVEQIVAAVKSAVEKVLPSFLAACFTKMVMPYNAAAPTINITNTNENNASANDIDFDFVGG
ncbi:MAG: adenylate cyclase [Ruminococcus sp.]|nr:adenylate cyclase [Ruminococcus sp.]